MCNFRTMHDTVIEREKRKEGRQKEKKKEQRERERKV
jgi:hypothetical protein